MHGQRFAQWIHSVASNAPDVRQAFALVGGNASPLANSAKTQVTAQNITRLGTGKTHPLSELSCTA